MPFIQNIAAAHVKDGFHKQTGDNAILIQIIDTDRNDWPIPTQTFRKIYRFKFLDVERDDPVLDESMRISDAQAAELIDILKVALENDTNVIVHCHAGVCRSGAVCEVGVIMGFDDTNTYRQPNLLVKHKLMGVLGLLYTNTVD